MAASGNAVCERLSGRLTPIRAENSRRSAKNLPHGVLKTIGTPYFNCLGRFAAIFVQATPGFERVRSTSEDSEAR